MSFLGRLLQPAGCSSASPPPKDPLLVHLEASRKKRAESRERVLAAIRRLEELRRTAPRL